MYFNVGLKEIQQSEKLATRGKKEHPRAAAKLQQLAIEPHDLSVNQKVPNPDLNSQTSVQICSIWPEMASDCRGFCCPACSVLLLVYRPICHHPWSGGVAS